MSLCIGQRLKITHDPALCAVFPLTESYDHLGIDLAAVNLQSGTKVGTCTREREESGAMLPTMGGLGGGAQVGHGVNGEIGDGVGEAVESGGGVDVRGTTEVAVKTVAELPAAGYAPS